MTNKPLKINKALTLVYFNNLILGELRRNGINSWIAGGVLRDYFLDLPFNSDCDIFFPNIDEFNKAKNYLVSNGGEIVWESENGMKINYKGTTFDLVKIILFPTPMETINDFDLTISMFATDGKDIYYKNSSLDDLQNKRLVIKNITNPLNTLKRVFKHYKKGFTISVEETKKLFFAIKSMPYYEEDDLLNANGRTSGEGAKTNTVFVSKDLPEEKPDYLKYAMIGVLALLVGYVAYKKFNKPQ